MKTLSFQYHLDTSYDRDDMSPHHLDWHNQPMVFKDYPNISPIPLPTDFSPPRERFSSLLKMGAGREGRKEMRLEDLTLILRLTSSLTAKARHSGGDFYFRSVASAGALYPTELYVAAHQVSGLGDGLYHYAIHRQCLYPLRSTNLAGQIAAMTHPPNNRTSLFTFFLSVIFFRSAWKYRDRSYRYDLLDTGHMAENLVSALKALRLPFDLSYDFDDRKVNEMLGLDETREVCLAVGHVPSDKSVFDAMEEEIGELEDKIRGASRVAAKEIDYPAVRSFHTAGASDAEWSTGKPEGIQELGVAPMNWTKSVHPIEWPETVNYPEVLFNRRSRRNFVKEAISEDQMAAFIESLQENEFSHSHHNKEGQRAVSIGFLAGHTDGTEPGFYLLDPAKESIGLVSAGLMMEKMAHVCLDQMWLTNAAVHFLFMANLDILHKTWGARGYRYAMLAAGRMGQRLYLAATAMGMGCCGIGAFYDGEAAKLLGLNEASKVLYLVAVGKVKTKIGAASQ